MTPSLPVAQYVSHQVGCLLEPAVAGRTGLLHGPVFGLWRIGNPKECLSIAIHNFIHNECDEAVMNPYPLFMPPHYHEAGCPPHVKTRRAV